MGRIFVSQETLGKVWRHSDCCNSGGGLHYFVVSTNQGGGGLAANRVWLFWPHGLWPARLLYPWNSPGKNTGVSCRFLLQGIFLSQRSNSSLLHLLHCRWILDLLSHWGFLHTYKMVKIQNSDNTEWWPGCETIGTLNCWWECKMVQPLWRVVCWILRKLNLLHYTIQQSSSLIFTQVNWKFMSIQKLNGLYTFILNCL